MQQVNYYYDSNPYYPSFSTNAVGRLAAVTFANEAGSAATPWGPGGTESSSTITATTSPGASPRQQLTVVPMSGYPVTLNATYSWDNQGRMTALNYPGPGPQETLSLRCHEQPDHHRREHVQSEEDNSASASPWSPRQLVSGASYTNIGQFSGFWLCRWPLPQATTPTVTTPCSS